MMVMSPPSTRCAFCPTRPGWIISLDYVGDDEALRAMFRWFAQGSPYKADLARSRSLVPEITSELLATL